MPLDRDKSNGYKVRLDDYINTGVFPDVFSSRIPLWETAVNVQFTEFGVEKIKGREKLVETGTAQPIRGVVQTERSGAPAVYLGDLTNLYSWTQADGLTNLNGPSGPYSLQEDTSGLTEASHWSMVEWGNWIAATNGVDLPQIDKGNGSFEDVTGLDVTTIKIFAVFGPHILGFNTDCSDREFVWCDADNPDDWVASAENLAGQLEIRELNTEIKAVVPIGSRLAVYGKDQMFLINYLANDLVFGYQAALNGIGAVSPKAVVPVGRRNFGLSTQGFFVTDGASFEYIDDPAVRHWYRRNVDQNQIAKVNAYHLEEDTQIRWYFRTKDSGSPALSYGLSYNYEKNAWSFLSEPYSASQERRVFDHAVVGSEGGALWLDGKGYDSVDGATTDPIVYTLRTKALDLGDADVVKELDSVRIGMRGGDLMYRVGWSEEESGTIVWEDYTGVVSAADGFDYALHRTAGRFLFLEVAADPALYPDGIAGADWELMSIECIGRFEGTR